MRKIHNSVIVTIVAFSMLIFFYSYWASVERPGAQSTKGWYGAWADQRRYYQQSQAISNFQLNKENFYYPIMYPLIGTFLIRLFPSDPFVLVNAFLFISTVLLLYQLIKKVFGRREAFYGVLLLVTSSRFVYDFVVPWTTSITTLTFLASLLILYTKPTTVKNVLLTTLFACIATLTRPSDIVFFLPLICGFILKNTQTSLKDTIKKLLVVSIILATCIGIFLSLNFAITGSVAGPYIERNVTSFKFRFSPLIILEKIVGYFFNSYIFHRQNAFFSSPLVVALPLYVTFLTLLPLLIKYWRDKKEKQYIVAHSAVAVSFIMWFVTHIPFDGVAPYTLKNLSLNYIKIWYPVMIFYLVYVIHYILNYEKIHGSFMKWTIIWVSILIFMVLALETFKPKLLNPETWEINASINQKSAAMIHDHNLHTFWDTPGPRKKGDFITMDMKKSHLINRLELFDEPSSAAVNFDTLISKDNTHWEKLAPNYTYNVRREYGWDIVGYMKKGRYIKLVLNEESFTDKWGIKEINVFGY